MGIWYDKEAYELLKKCSDAKDLTEWNEERKAKNYSLINLRFANCNGFYLREAELQYVDFRFAQLNNTDFTYSNVSNTNISTSGYWSLLIIFLFLIGILVAIVFNISGKSFNVLLNYSIISITFAYLIFNKTHVIRSVRGTFLFAAGSIGLMLISAILSAISIFGGVTYFYYLIGTPTGTNFNLFGMAGAILGLALGFSLSSVIYMSRLKKIEIENTRLLSVALNPEKVIGIRENELEQLIKNLSISLSIAKQIFLLKQQQYSENKLRELEEKRDWFIEEEDTAEVQKERINNIIKELESPYEYFKDLIKSIDRYIYFFYSVICISIIWIFTLPNTGFFINKIKLYDNLFTHQLPTFGTIFGVIISIVGPFLVAVSIIFYAISQVNKNFDKKTELQEQERNIKQIASTIKAKAQIGMSDEEFVKETKNLIQKYQEGMMAGMFNKEKISDKEDKSSSSTYREKMIANGMSKLLMQALKK